MSATASGPRLGVTLYSFTPDFHAGRYSVAELIRMCAERNLGPGLEIVGFQSLRGFPRFDGAEVRAVRAAIEDSGLEPSCLGTNADVALRSDRLLSDEELADYVGEQIRCAAKLGFPTVRVQNNANPAVLERLLPLAEREDVKMGMEIHAPSSVDSPWVLAVRELIARLDTAHLGFCPDFGASTRAVSPSLIEEFRRRGASEELLQSVVSLWESVRANPPRTGEDAIGAFFELGDESERQFAEALAIFVAGLHGVAEPASWTEIMPNIVHVHGKFFGFDEAGNEPAVPYETLLPLLADGGYDGYISSEWEGWHWNWSPDAFAMIEKHHVLARRILAADA